MASGPWLGNGLPQDQLPMEQQAQQQTQPQQQQSLSSASSIQSIPNGNGDASLDRQMLRHLMARYSEQELARLILEERASPATSMLLTRLDCTDKVGKLTW